MTSHFLEHFPDDLTNDDLTNSQLIFAFLWLQPMFKVYK